MRSTTVSPLAARPATTRQAEARRSVAITWAPDSGVPPLTTAVRPFTDVSFASINEGWAEIVTRFEAEEGVQDRVRDVRFLVRARIRQNIARATTVSRVAWTWTRTATRKGWTRAEQLLRIGRSAVQGERITGESRRATLEALADIDHMMAELPLVYRRLFSLQAVADRMALQGRGEELELVRTWHATWEEGLTDALILSGWSGGGLGSFYAASIATVVEGGTEVKRIGLDTRITAEDALAARIAGALGIEGEFADPGGSSTPMTSSRSSASRASRCCCCARPPATACSRRS